MTLQHGRVSWEARPYNPSLCYGFHNMITFNEHDSLEQLESAKGRIVEMAAETAAALEKITGQLNAARDQYLRTGEAPDPNWQRRASDARRHKMREADSLASDLENVRNAIKRKMAALDERSTVDALLSIVRQKVSPELSANIIAEFNARVAAHH